MSDDEIATLAHDLRTCISILTRVPNPDWDSIESTLAAALRDASREQRTRREVVEAVPGVYSEHQFTIGD